MSRQVISILFRFIVSLRLFEHKSTARLAAALTWPGLQSGDGIPGKAGALHGLVRDCVGGLSRMRAVICIDAMRIFSFSSAAGQPSGAAQPARSGWTRRPAGTFFLITDRYLARRPRSMLWVRQIPSLDPLASRRCWARGGGRCSRPPIFCKY
jgi:hypothetical protein